MHAIQYKKVVFLFFKKLGSLQRTNDKLKGRIELKINIYFRFNSLGLLLSLLSVALLSEALTLWPMRLLFLFSSLLCTISTELFFEFELQWGVVLGDTLQCFSLSNFSPARVKLGATLACERADKAPSLLCYSKANKAVVVLQARGALCCYLM